MKLIIILLIVFNITIAVSADDFYKPAVSADSPIMNTATFSENFRMGACCEICNAKLDKDCLEKDHIFAFIPVNQCKAIQISKKRSEYGGQAYFMDWQKLGCNDRLTSLEKVCSLGPNLWKGTEYEKVYTPEKCSEALKIRSIPDKTVSLKLDLIISKNLQSVKDSDSKLYSKIMKELNSEKEKLIKDFNLRFAAADKKDRDFQRNNFLKSLTEYSKCENSDLECQKVVDLKKRERYLSSLSYNSQCESKDLECIKIVEALKRKVFLSTLSYNSQCENNDKECQDTVNHLKRKEYLRKLTADSSCYSGDEECKNIVNKHREKEKLKKEKELAAAQRKYKALKEQGPNSTACQDWKSLNQGASAVSGMYRSAGYDTSGLDSVIRASETGAAVCEFVDEPTLQSAWNLADAAQKSINGYSTAPTVSNNKPDGYSPSTGQNTTCGFSSRPDCTQKVCNELHQLEGFLGQKTGNGLGQKMNASGLSENNTAKFSSQVNSIKSQCGWN